MMSEKEQQSTYPMAPASTQSVDAESGAAQDKRNKKRSNRIMYFVLFVVFQTAVIAVFSLTIMRVRAPKFRVSAAVITGVSAGVPANSSFSATLNAELAIKNPNFGRYKYDGAIVEFFHDGGASAGKAIVSSSRVSIKSTKRFQVTVDLNLTGSPQLARDLSDGVLRLSCKSKMKGKVEFMFGVMKKESSATMNCSMDIVIATQVIRNITCL